MFESKILYKFKYLIGKMGPTKNEIFRPILPLKNFTNVYFDEFQITYPTCINNILVFNSSAFQMRKRRPQFLANKINHHSKLNFYG